MSDRTSGDQLNDFLTRCFSEEEDARLLQCFFQHHADAEHFTYADVRLSQEETQDLLMLGLEQRVILPEKTRMGPAWEDRILTFDAEVVFLVPPIVRQIARVVGGRETFQMNSLLASIFVGLSESDITDMARLRSTIMANSRERLFEAACWLCIMTWTCL